MDPREERKARLADESQPLIVLGRVGRVHGVQGWVRLHSYTEPRTALLDYDHVFVHRDGDWHELRIAEANAHGKGLIARFAGVDDRDGAAALTGADVGVRRADMPDPGDGHYYWADLEGLVVKHRDGRELGTVERLLATGANDVMVVTGEREILIPFVPDTVILDVDLAGKVISVDWEWD